MHKSEVKSMPVNCVLCRLLNIGSVGGFGPDQADATQVWDLLKKHSKYTCASARSWLATRRTRARV